MRDKRLKMRDIMSEEERAIADASGLELRARQLHSSLDMLVADFINDTGRLPSQTTVMELMEWSNGRMEKESKKGTVKQ